MNTFRKSLVKVVTLSILSILCSPVYAAFIGGSAITPSTTLAPVTINGFTYIINQIADGIALNADAPPPYNGFTTNAATGTIRLDFVGTYNLTGFVLANDVNVSAEGINTFRLDFFNASGLITSSGILMAPPQGQIAPATYPFSMISGVSRVDLVVLSSRARIEIREVGFIGTSVGQVGPCNSVISQTIFPPDGMGNNGNFPTVFVTVQQQVPDLTNPPSDRLAKCQGSFATPVIPPFWTNTQKCDALVNAISSSVQCGVDGFQVTNNSCATLQSFQLTGTLGTKAVTLAISNVKNLNQDNLGVTLPNYEEEVITPGCLGAAGGLGTEPKGLLAVKGTATGVSFVAGQSAAIQVVVDQTSNGGALTTKRVNTTAGMTAASIVSQLNSQLAQAGVICSLVTSPFAAILCTQPSSGSANGFGISTSDTGIGIGNASGPANTIMNAFTIPGPGVPAPLPLPALVVLASLLAGSGIVVGRRKRK